MRSLALFLIGLFFGGGLGFIVAAAYGVTLSGHDHSDPSQHGPGTDHATHDMAAHAALEIPAEGAPTIAITLHPDGEGSINLEVATTNFRFAPEQVNGPHTPGAGHAHAYVNGVKVARLYGPWAQITGVSSGDTVLVTLNANSHEELSVDGVLISATAQVP